MCVRARMHIYTHVHTHPYTCPHTCRYTCLYICLSIHMPLHMSVHMSMHMSVPMSIHVPLHMSIPMSIYYRLPHPRSSSPPTRSLSLARTTTLPTDHTLRTNPDAVHQPWPNGGCRRQCRARSLGHPRRGSTQVTYPYTIDPAVLPTSETTVHAGGVPTAAGARPVPTGRTPIGMAGAEASDSDFSEGEGPSPLPQQFQKEVQGTRHQTG